ncbi:MAG: hypothetical protein Q9159_004004 [Coniocarpon cinnabarinum]
MHTLCLRFHPANHTSQTPTNRYVFVCPGLARPRAQNDVDIIDGLPVRQWRLSEVLINTTPDAPPSEHANAQNLPNEKTLLPNGRPPLGLPPGSQYYTPWCKQILKVMRAGKLGKRKDRDDDHDDEKENGDQEDSAEAAKLGFTARRWNPVPRNAEEPEDDYLAPRRPGLVRAAEITSSSFGLNGEVAVNGAATEEPARRRVPPPRKKPKKGPGRRKKMTEGDGTGVSASAEALEGAHAGGDHTDGDLNGDGEAGDDNEGEDEDGEEGDEGADDDREEGELSDAKEEDSKGLLSKFQGKEEPVAPPQEVKEPEKLPTPIASEKIPNLPAPPVQISLPGLGQIDGPSDKEEGEVDAEEDEEDYEPPPAPAPISALAVDPARGLEILEEDEGEYEPPPPSAPNSATVETAPASDSAAGPG